jgi:hypothetical protein
VLRWNIADGCGPTGRTLQELVGNVRGEAVVCWGMGYQGELPSLNRQASRYNKLEQLRVLRDAGILTVPFFERTQLPTAAENYPLLGRQFRHHGGRDINLIMQPADAQFAQADFYTRYVPRQTEFRTWVYRRRHLATYEKVLAHPERYRRIGANFRNGFAFRLVPGERVPEDLREISGRVVDALGLDFGAVDILRGVDGRHYVLELNTAPGVEDEARFGIQQLAAKIQRWAQLGFVRRNGDRNA